jgi:glycosyltransferase involved in cell wall biosynthesis
VLSVIVPTRNRAPVLARCLDALRGEAMDEVVVVDDGSTDATWQVLQSRSWVQAVRRDHGGRSAAKNTGIEAAAGDLVLFIDDDVIAAPGLVARHATHHAQHSNPNEALLGRVTWAPEIEVSRHMRWLERGGPLFAYDLIEDPDRVEWRMLYTANVSLKREFLEPFDPRLPIYEDSELGYRLSRRGLRLRYDPLALGHHLRVQTPKDTERRMRSVGAAAAVLHAKWPELREPPPPMSLRGSLKGAAGTALSRLGYRRFDDLLDEWRAARAYARGYAELSERGR